MQVTELQIGQDKQIIMVNADGTLHVEMIIQDDIGVEVLENL